MAKDIRKIALSSLEKIEKAKQALNLINNAKEVNNILDEIKGDLEDIIRSYKILVTDNYLRRRL